MCVGVAEFCDVWPYFEAADQVGASAWNRFASRSLGVLDRFLQLRRLYRFNLKFAPLWVPRFWRRSRRWRWRNVVGCGRAWRRGFYRICRRAVCRIRSRFFLQMSWRLFARCSSLLWRSFLRCRVAIRLEQPSAPSEALRGGMDPYPLGGEIRSNGASILGVKDALRISL